MQKLVVLPVAKTMSSREIAEITGKEHSKVIVDIERILAEVGIGDAVFRASYISEQNKRLACYNLPRRECDLIIAGYSAKYRLAIIDRWQELEAAQAPALPNYQEALRQLADSLDKQTQLEQKIMDDAPKVEFAIAVRRMEGACKIGDFCKVIGMGRNTMFARMRKDEILMADNMPYQRYIDSEYFVVIEQTPYTDREGRAHPTFTTMVTGKGQVWLEKKYRVPSSQKTTGD